MHAVAVEPATKVGTSVTIPMMWPWSSSLKPRGRPRHAVWRSRCRCEKDLGASGAGASRERLAPGSLGGDGRQGADGIAPGKSARLGRPTASPDRQRAPRAAERLRIELPQEEAVPIDDLALLVEGVDTGLRRLIRLARAAGAGPFLPPGTQGRTRDSTR